MRVCFKLISTSHIFSKEEKSWFEIAICFGKPIINPSFFLGNIKPALSGKL